ncbi:MAG: preprotein translocase subunit YajC [Gammaproteobacteria bacterium]|nr:MAG: preprotein translocase subunit YajC [Gammaproteobacteria bacterium]
MSLFISDAFAQAPAAPPQGAGLDLLFMVVFFGVIMYFMIIRPQQKRAKEHRKMIEALREGDEVATSGGLLGVVTRTGDDIISIEIADGVEIKVQPQAITAVLPKGTIKKG